MLKSKHFVLTFSFSKHFETFYVEKPQQNGFPLQNLLMKQKILVLHSGTNDT